MRNQILIQGALTFVLLLLAGCQFASWQPGGMPYTAAGGDYTIRVPAGWMFVERPPGHVVSSRDGLLLQRIVVERRELKDPLPLSKRTLNANLTPFELAEGVADDLRADRSMLGLEVSDNKPANVGGRSGFNLVVNFHTVDKLRVSEQIFGCVAGERLYLLVYAAPARYYFDRDRAAFEETVRTFQFGKL